MTENIIVMLLAAEVMAPASEWRMAPFCVRQPLLSSSPQTPPPDRRSNWGRREEDVQRNKRQKGEIPSEPSPMKPLSALWPPLSTNTECSLISVPLEMILPAGISGFGSTRCHSSVSTEMSSSSNAPGGSLRADTQTDRQTNRRQHSALELK